MACTARASRRPLLPPCAHPRRQLTLLDLRLANGSIAEAVCCHAPGRPEYGRLYWAEYEFDVGVEPPSPPPPV